MNYVFDIDGTLCTHSQTEYMKAKPLYNRIKVVNRLYEEGHYIIISTARGMNSFDNNSKLAKLKWEEFTKQQLANWGVKYHKLFLGKPSGDIYIDDKAVSDLDFFVEN